jgi:hypothetical protein
MGKYKQQQINKASWGKGVQASQFLQESTELIAKEYYVLTPMLSFPVNKIEWS